LPAASELANELQYRGSVKTDEGIALVGIAVISADTIDDGRAKTEERSEEMLLRTSVGMPDRMSAVIEEKRSRLSSGSGAASAVTERRRIERALNCMVTVAND